MKKTVSSRHSSCFLCGGKPTSILHAQVGPNTGGYQQIGSLEVSALESTIPVFQFKGDRLPQHNISVELYHATKDIKATAFSGDPKLATEEKLKGLAGIADAKIALGTYSYADARFYTLARVQLTLNTDSQAPSTQEIDDALKALVESKSGVEFKTKHHQGHYVLHVSGMMCAQVCPSSIENLLLKHKLTGCVTFVDTSQSPGKDNAQRLLVSGGKVVLSKLLASLKEEGFTVTRLDISQGIKRDSLTK